MAQTYEAKSIQVLEGLDAVRMRPGMYIGSTGSRGLHHLLWEIVDNAIDEAANGYADEILVTLHQDGSASVFDNGRGMPVDTHPTLGISGVEVIYTKLHAGGKFNNENYSYSGGLHGVGASVVNALSKWVTVDVFRDWTHWRISFASKYDPKLGKVTAGIPQGPLEKVGNTRKKGSLVRFLPDDTIFEDTRFNSDLVARHLQEQAFLNKGLRIVFTDERDKNPETRERIFHYEGGIVDFVKYLDTDKNVLHEQPVYLEGQREDIIFKASFQYTDGYTENIFSYANNIPTGEGGSHETGFKAAFTKAFNDYARRIGALKEKDNNLSGEDFREGLTCVMIVMVKNPQFEGQTKGRLGNTEVRPAVEAIVSRAADGIPGGPEKPGAGPENRGKGRPRRPGAGSQPAKPGTWPGRRTNWRPRPWWASWPAAPAGTRRITSCSSSRATPPVAAPSRAGTAASRPSSPCGASPSTPKRSAWTRCWPTRNSAAMITALGTSIEDGFNLSSLKYNKVIILSDADQDGAHIRAILLTFFYRYMRELVSTGHVYIGMPPLYKVQKGRQGLVRLRRQGTVQVHQGRGQGLQPAALQGPGRNEPRAALGHHHGPQPAQAPPGDHRRRRPGGQAHHHPHGGQGGAPAGVYQPVCRLQPAGYL